MNVSIPARNVNDTAALLAHSCGKCYIERIHSARISTLMNRLRTLGAVVCAPLIISTAAPSAGLAQDRGMAASELRLELKKLSVLGSVLYIAAHPDDENTNLLAYLSKGRLVRTAYLSVTRGEGGQNLIGREQGDALGVVRTEELLAARRIDGAEQFFTRAIDFGYSKSSDEAIRFWGGDETVSDIVRVMRTFRPDVVITRFSPTIGGHGQHTASAILARKAFDLAGDPTYQPSPGGNLAPWKPVRLLFNGSQFMLPEFDTSSAMKVNTGGYNTLLGESYNEISGRSRSMHKSQGFGAAQNRGDVINYFHHTAGSKTSGDILDGVEMGWSRVPAAEAASRTLAEAQEKFDPEQPSSILPILLKAYNQLKALGDDPWAVVKRRDLQAVILASAGIRAEALASAGSASPGDSLRIRASVINRSGHPFVLKSVRTAFARTDSAPGTALANNKITTVEFRVTVPPSEPVTMPYWLERPAVGARYDIADPSLIGSPRRPSPYRAIFTLGSPDGDIAFDVPVEFKVVDPVEGEVYRPFIIAPPVSIVPEENVLLFPSSAPKTLTVRIAGGREGAAGTLKAGVPAGWTVTPPEIPFRVRSGGEERFSFAVAPGKGAASGEFTVAADAGGATVTTGTTVIKYPHIPAQTIFPPASGRLVVADVKKKKSFIGYIEGSGDAVPDALRQAGYDVRLLTDDDLLSAELSVFQSIVAGVRAYNTRPALTAAQQRLMEYVRRGGTYVAQYSTAGRNESPDVGPYPFKISRDRVSDETAPVTLLDPTHPALSYPNAIGESDFAGWVQERGLYFADSLDSAYAPLLSAADPGEPARTGGLIVARHGEGYFCYTGLSFFRQLPAGVPGAYRLFVNLVELGSREKAGKGK
jgi:LmbE family N-acetylglucosaminyl deacetylase